MSQTSVTNIQVNDSTTFINQAQAAGTTVGMGTLPAGSTVPQAAHQFEQALMAKLLKDFASTFPSVTLPGSNTDNGYMGPFTSAISGTAPQCVVQQVSADFSRWGLPTNTSVPSTIGQTVTNEMTYQGGVPNFSSGTYQVSSSENIYWMAGYSAFDVTQSELGCIYVLAAAVGFNL